MREGTARLALVLALALGIVSVLSAPARADVDWGLRAGVYDDADEPFVGGELLVDVWQRWFFNPNLEVVLVDDGSLVTLNGDVHYDFPLDAPFAVWAGGGPAVIFIEPDDDCRRCEDETDIGLNLLAGAGLQRGAVRPYVQGKVILADDREVSLAIGVRFH